MNIAAWILCLSPAGDAGFSGPTGLDQPPAPLQVRVIWGDVDEDGLQDALVLDVPRGRESDGETGALRLLANRGPSGFEDVTARSGLPAGPPPRSAGWTDLDADGGSDLVLVTARGELRLLRNAGGRFEDASAALGGSFAGVTGVAPADLDGDRWPDLLVQRAGAGPLVLFNRQGIGFEAVELGGPGEATPPGAGHLPPGAGPVHPEPEQTPEVAEGSRPVGTGPEETASSSGVGSGEEMIPPGGTVPEPAALGGLPPGCTTSLDDMAGGGCLQASRIPMLGMLYPLSSELFVDLAGNVGVGTTAPLAKLDVRDNDLHVEGGGIELRDGTRLAIDLDPSVLRITNEAGVETVLLDGESVGGELRLRNDSGAQTVVLDSEPTVGTVSLRDDAGIERFFATGGQGEGGRISLRNSAAVETFTLDSDEFDRGTLELLSSTGALRFFAGTTLDGAGYMNLRNASGILTIVADAEYTQDESILFLYNRNGLNTLFLDTKSNEGGYISVRDDTSGLTNEIQLQARNEAGVAQIGVLDPAGNLTVAMVNVELGAGSLSLFEPDGSYAFSMRGSHLLLYSSGGAVTQQYNRHTGQKSAVVDTASGGRRLVYAIESPELWFQDSGRGRLEGGAARIDLDPVFLETVTVDEEHPLQVTVTATSAVSGLFVEKGGDHFVVRAGGAGSALDTEATFDWRVAAKRRGTEGMRLEPLEETVDEDREPVPQAH